MKDSADSEAPTVRMSGAALPRPTAQEGSEGPEVVLVFRRNGALMMINEGTVVEVVSGPGLATIGRHLRSTRSDTTVLCADDDTASILVRELERQHRPTGRFARACVALPASTRIAVLSRCLARKYHARVDTSDLNEWRKAFGLAPGPGAIVALCDLALASGLATEAHRDGERLKDQMIRNALKSIAQNELKLSQALRTTRSRAATNNVAFLASEAICTAWAAVEVFDPLARHEFVADGTVVVADPIGETSDGAIACSLTTPCTLKIGDVSFMPNGSGVAVGGGVLTHLTVNSSGLVGVFAPGSVHSSSSGQRRFTPMRAALAERTTLLATCTPYLGDGFSNRLSDWWTDAARTRSPRPVPSDVAAAAGR